MLLSFIENVLFLQRWNIFVSFLMYLYNIEYNIEGLQVAMIIEHFKRISIVDSLKCLILIYIIYFPVVIPCEVIFLITIWYHFYHVQTQH